MCETFSCGFSRVAAKLSVLKDGKIVFDMKSRWERYHSFFGGHQEQHELSLKCFRKRLKSLLDIFDAWRKTSLVEKDNYLQHFSSDKWQSLSTLQKQYHSVRDCRACMVNHQVIQSTFPLHKMLLSSGKNGPVAVSKKVASSLARMPKPVRSTKKAMAETTNTAYDNVNKSFQELYGIEYSEAQTKIPRLCLQKKTSRSQNKKNTRDIRRADKKLIEKMLADTEAESVLATRQSLSQRNKKRKMQFFESRDEAELRAKKRKELEESGQRVPKRHSPDPESVDFNRDGLLEEVRQMKDGDPVSIYNYYLSQGGETVHNSDRSV